MSASAMSGTGVWVGVLVRVGVWVIVGVGVAVGVRLGLGVEVWVGVGVIEGVGEGLAVEVALGCPASTVRAMAVARNSVGRGVRIGPAAWPLQPSKEMPSKLGTKRSKQVRQARPRACPGFGSLGGLGKDAQFDIGSGNFAQRDHKSGHAEIVHAVIFVKQLADLLVRQAHRIVQPGANQGKLICPS